MTRPLLHPAAALALSALGGIVLSWSFPEPGWWWAAPLGVAAMLVPLIGRSGTGALAVGLAGGLGFYGSLVSWTSLFLGPVPYVALASLMAAFVAVGSLAIAHAYAWLPIAWPGRAGRLLALPVAVGGLWTLREAIASNWPYGGFAWGRVAQSQSASPFGELVAWLGLSGLTFLIVTLTALAVEAARILASARWPQLSNVAELPPSVARLNAARAPVTRAEGAARAVAIASGIAVLAAIPAFPVTPTDTLRVAAVQGGTPQAGYFLRGQPGDVLAAHLATSATIDPASEVDVILWPEGSVDLSPVYNARAAAALSRLSQQAGAPILANTVTVQRGATEADDEYFNTQFVWDDGVGLGETVDKQRPVPFGEYVPDRDFWYALAPDLIGLIQRGYTPGEGPAVLEVAGVPVGVLICFDVIEDGVVHDAVRSGAQVMLAPTNNADFGVTNELPQQLAFARLRAIETGRATVQVSTVGDSAVFGPDGAVLASLPHYEPGVMIIDVPLSDTLTPAVVAGRAIEWLAGGAGLALLLGSRLGRRRQRAASA